MLECLHGMLKALVLAPALQTREETVSVRHKLTADLLCADLTRMDAVQDGCVLTASLLTQGMLPPLQSTLKHRRSGWLTMGNSGREPAILPGVQGGC